MIFKEKLKKYSQQEIWDEYCGFLDLSIDEYMGIQFRLLEEQINLFSDSGLGKRIIKGDKPSSVKSFREQVPLTKYEDYQSILLEKRADMLPKEPVVWLETTWESGSKPVKVAPYSREMLDVYTRNILAAMILSTSEDKYKFHVQSGAKVLYGLAPLPYATGLFPLLINSEIDLKFMPSIKEAKTLSFSQQNKVGFSEAAKCGIDQFFGMSSIVYTITKNFESLTASSKINLRKLVGMNPRMLFKILKAKYVSKRDGRGILPKDIFNLKGFVCVGTDTALFKNELENAWGIKPLEIHGGTEPSCLATETWSKNGLVFFPDTAFYEFIPKEEVYKSERDSTYIPKTYLMDEVVANEEYELVISVFKGGAFMRYRVGDMYRCIKTLSEKDNVRLPHFEYIDRVPSVIDIAGFTRITKSSIEKVIKLSGLPINDWVAMKEYDGDKYSFVHLFVELDVESERAAFLSEQLILEHMSAYFKHFDHDYSDFKRFLGKDPLVVTILPVGSISNYEKNMGKFIRRINPNPTEIIDLLESIGGGFGRGGGYFGSD